MTERISIHDYQRLLKLRQDIVNDVNIRQTNIDGVTFRRILNLSSVEIYLKHDYSEDVLVEEYWQEHWTLVSAQYCLNSPTNLTKFLKKYNIHDMIQKEYSIRWDLSFNQIYKICIVPGILYKSDEESGMGSGSIYACARFNKNEPKDHKNKPRYDYVFIDYGDSEPVLARVLLILDISRLHRPENDNDSKMLLLIQHLIKKPNHGSILGDIYEFASEPDNRNVFRFDIVSVQSILRPAFVVPVFRKSYNPLSHSAEDRFWVLDRRFFDRSGWVTKANEDLDSEYIKIHQTANRILQSDEYYLDNNIIGRSPDEDADLSEEEYNSDIC